MFYNIFFNQIHMIRCFQKLLWRLYPYKKWRYIQVNTNTLYIIIEVIINLEIPPSCVLMVLYLISTGWKACAYYKIYNYLKSTEKAILQRLREAKKTKRKVNLNLIRSFQIQIISTQICTTQGYFMTLLANIIELVAECCVLGFMGISAVTFGAGI